MAVKKGNKRPDMPRNRVMRRLVKFGKGTTVATSSGKERPINTDRFIPKFGDDEHESDDDAVLLQAIADIFGDVNPKVLNNVYLLDVDFDDDSETEVTYQLDYEHWANGLLVKRCDGEHISKQYSQQQKRHVFREDYIGGEHETHFDCRNSGSFAVQDSGQYKGSLDCGCKFKARLRLVSPDMIRDVDTVYGYIEVESGARSDDVSIIACLRYIDEQFAKPRGLLMTQVPLKIYRETMPNYTHGGKKHVIRVSVDYVEYEKIAAERPLLPVVLPTPEVSATIQPASRESVAQITPLSFDDIDADEPELYADMLGDDAFDDSDVDGGFDDAMTPPRLDPLDGDENAMLARLSKIVTEYLGVDLSDLLAEIETTEAEFAANYPDLSQAKFALLQLADELALPFKVTEFVAEKRRENWSTYSFNIGLTVITANSRESIVAPFVKAGGDADTLKASIKKSGVQTIKDTLGVDCLYVTIVSSKSKDNIISFKPHEFTIGSE